MPSPIDRNELRRAMRAARRRVAPQERTLAAKAFARIVNRLRLVRPGMHVAIYHAYGHEADASQIIGLARERGCTVYLPAITHVRHSKMRFVRFDADTALGKSSYGIPEPDRRAIPRPVRQIDVIFLPLVAFDKQGWRLGSGAGFYDRHLSHLRIGRKWRRPKLIGIAYDFQRVPRLEANHWDIPMDAVITDRRMYRMRHPL